MHRGTTIEDAGYKGGHSWPIVPDVKSAQENEKLFKYLLIGSLPAAAIAYFIAAPAGVGIAMGIAALVLVIDFATAFLVVKKRTHDLLVNCKMIKLIAEYAGADVEHTAKVVFEAVNRKGGTERLEPLSETGGVYVNAGYKMDDGRVELPYIIYIRKVDKDAQEDVSEAA